MQSCYKNEQFFHWFMVSIHAAAQLKGVGWLPTTGSSGKVLLQPYAPQRVTRNKVN